MMSQPGLAVTSDDIEALCAMNPLAAEQLKVLMLQRHISSLEQQLAAQQNNGHVDEPVPEEVGVE